MKKKDLLFPHCFVASESTLQVSDALKIIWKQILVQTLHFLFKKFQFICLQIIYILHQVTVMIKYTIWRQRKKYMSYSFNIIWSRRLTQRLSRGIYLICSLYHWLRVKDYMMLHENLKIFVQYMQIISVQ